MFLCVSFFNKYGLISCILPFSTLHLCLYKSQIWEQTIGDCRQQLQYCNAKTRNGNNLQYHKKKTKKNSHMFDEFHVDKIICVQLPYTKSINLFGTPTRKHSIVLRDKKTCKLKFSFAKNFTKLCERIVSNGMFNTKGITIS